MPPQANQYLTWIEAEIRRQRFGRQPESLYEPIRYIMQLGGKRLRPMLTLLGYSLYRDDARKIVPLACAVEAFHNFTLMHDDIMDKAPLRRGKQTVHKKWNVNTAILAGDVMLVKVYDMLLSAPPEMIGNVLKAFNKCAAEVCEGQQWDMEFETRDNVTEREYLNMIRQKTAVLLGFSLELGAILGGAPANDIAALRSFGENVGVGFQLRDDLLDAYADPKKFGKQVGGDIIANKKTYLLIKAIDKTKGKQKRELISWLEKKTFNKKEKISGVKAIFDSANIPALAVKKSNSFFERGFSQLEALDVPPSKKALLKNFAGQLIERQS